MRPMRRFNDGSSPRLRGTDPPAIQKEVTNRFIPAPAGNSARRAAGLPAGSVHPRACGEQVLRLAQRPLPGGSSPRLRGTDRSPHVRASTDRFIPAPAGNSASLPDAGDHTPVHPRACGEQVSSLRSSAPSIGSSPRLRGTGERLRGRAPGRRFIPAPAGNRRAGGPPSPRQPVHPRACGEQIVSAVRSRCVSGSSPRLRGTDLAFQQLHL